MQIFHRVFNCSTLMKFPFFTFPTHFCKTGTKCNEKASNSTGCCVAKGGDAAGPIPTAGRQLHTHCSGNCSTALKHSLAEMTSKGV